MLSGSNRVTDAGLAQLGRINSLKVLSIAQANAITDQGLAHLKNLKQLEYLDLTATTEITDAGVAHLTELKQLKMIHLSSASKLTDATVDSLLKLPRLEGVVLDVHSITDGALRRLPSIKTLENVCLVGRKSKVIDEVTSAIYRIEIPKTGAPAATNPPSGLTPPAAPRN